jgi:hypothetical protein
MKTVIISITFVVATHAWGQPTAAVAPAPRAKAANAFSAPSPVPPKISSSSKRVEYRVSRSSVPAVVVQFSAVEPSRIQEMSEDLDVMTHLIDQALSEENPDETPPDKMGIKLYLTGSTRSIRGLYMEDFGALFMIKVNFPLQGVPPKEEQAPQKTTDSEWERARREVFGPGEAAWSEVYEGVPVNFDPKRVEALKAVLLRTLKNASNIRHLKPGEFVSLSVFGSAPRIEARPTPEDAPRTSNTPRRKAVAASGYGSGYGLAQDLVIADSFSASAQGTVLTLRVKKEDIDAFAKGDINEDAFVKKAAFNSYRGAGHDVTSINTWVNQLSRP